MLPPRVPPILRAINGYSRLQWAIPPRNIFVVKKDFDSRVNYAAKSLVDHLVSKYKVNVLVEPRAYPDLAVPGVHAMEQHDLRKYVDLVVTLGGDGTILHATSLFNQRAEEMPPVLSFSMGTLGFLLPFDYGEAHSAFHKVYTGESTVLRRSRLEVRNVHVPPVDPGPLTPGSLALDPAADVRQLAAAAATRARRIQEAIETANEDAIYALNDVTIHRGSSPHLAHLDIAVNDQHVTTAIADGVTVSTPTGSTAYSLSAGGSIVHPSVPCILLTPICPRSLSFRPLIFPQDAKISISVSEDARGPSEMSIDGYSHGRLAIGDVVEVGAGDSHAVWCVARDTDDWVHNLNGLLGFNSKFGGTKQ